ncbi:Maf family nucleotide pyrophosphatase [Candidatus Anaplasma sp. TIGMIC]|uniref:Maf family nucleotide pyrophosphatase n=1 Tax=Candidatus Anaplasma sp. TIGMIC TaxID=3020713 RepID=UPI00232AF61E|nr:Maf family nucleotide pyrophosphatase [Candidatus Anaplasma sp. TIGMIC]MDB1134981.1 Maf family nucleotide pyrophosphatase [Candidatus Anaplasma sp. TIGMIC]
MLKIDSLVLPSSSEYRLSLLEQIGVVPGEVVSPDVDESVNRGELPRSYAERVAKDKVVKVAATRPGMFVLGADTVAYCGRRVMLKTDDVDQAIGYLRLVSGRRHRVCTAICLSTPEGEFRTRSVVSIVKFKRLSEGEISYYAHSGQWKNKAGGYSIQGWSSALISWMQGSYSAVVGLPLHETYCLLSGYFDLVHIP